MNLVEARNKVNFTRYRTGQAGGHYESFFVRANHPVRPLAFWIRYTIFSPVNYPDRAIGEIWTVFFDGEKGRHYAAKDELPYDQCAFSGDSFSIRAGRSIMGPDGLSGGIRNKKYDIRWNLASTGGTEPLFDFPLRYYDSGFPKAKALVARPLAVFDGTINTGGNIHRIKRWTGSQNHNWGSKHTDHYAWGQVAGFDGSPESFLELGTGRIRIGPVWSPFMTPIVLRHQGEEFALNNFFTSLGRASFSYFTWNFHARSKAIRLEGSIRAERKDFVCLPYFNPPGGIKSCLNTKIAECRLKIWRGGSTTPELLVTPHRAAFEILTDRTDHGMPFDI